MLFELRLKQGLQFIAITGAGPLGCWLEANVDFDVVDGLRIAAYFRSARPGQRVGHLWKLHQHGLQFRRHFKRRIEA